MHRSNGRSLVGIILLIIGGFFLLRNLDVFTWEFEHYYLGWPTFIFILGLILTIIHRGSFGGFSLMIVGGVFFFSRYYHYSVGEIFHDIWPVFLILFGLSMLFKHNSFRRRKNKNKFTNGSTESFAGSESNMFTRGKDHKSNHEHQNRSHGSWIDYSDDTLDITTMFAENKRRIISQNFRFAKVSTLFGSTELDFTDAKVAPNCVIDCDTLFGGTEIIIPSSWQVINQSTAVFGGADDSRRKSAPVEGEEQMKITVKGSAIFGGIEIKS